MSRYVVLRLDFYVFGKLKGELGERLEERYREELRIYHEEITPVFNREGIYLDRETGYSWFETDGRAYKYEKEKVKYELCLCNASEKGVEVYKLLDRLEKTSPKVLSRPQKHFLQMYRVVIAGKRSRRASLRYLKELKGRIKLTA